MNCRKTLTFFVLFLLTIGIVLAYDVSMDTDKYYYSANDTIYSEGQVKINNSDIANVTVTVYVYNETGHAVDNKTFVSNSTGGFNYTFPSNASGNFTIMANASGDYVQHKFKETEYKYVKLLLDKQTYSALANATLKIKTEDAGGNGISNKTFIPSLRYTNKTIISTLTTCITDTLGNCEVNFTIPSDDGEYIVEVNSFEHGIKFVVGGFEPSLKISPSVTSRDGNITIRVVIKNANGNGMEAAGRRLVITSPNGTEYTVSSMTAYNDSTGTTLTGVYSETFLNTTAEGVWNVKAVITPQGSNVSRELRGIFEVRGYTADIIPWMGTSVFYPGSAVTMGVKLRNATSNDFITGKESTIKSGLTVLDESDKEISVSKDVTAFSSMNVYRLDFTISTNTRPGNYKIKLFLNDSVGTAQTEGFFVIQVAKAEMATLDALEGSVKKTFLPGKQIVIKMTARNSSGYVNVNSIAVYKIIDKFGNDVTSSFMNRTTYTNTTGNSVTGGFINMTAPKLGGWYTINAKMTTDAGTVVGESWFEINAMDVTIRPISTSTEGGPMGGMGGGPMGGPGYFFFFKPSDEVQFNVSVTTAQEKEEGSEFMGEFSKGGGPGGPMMMEGGFGGIGGGSAISGAKVNVNKIINIRTEEDMTSSATITPGITNSAGAATVKLKSNINNQQWSGGFYIVFFNISTTDNQTDETEGFFEVKRFFVDVQVSANTSVIASEFGFMSSKNWNIGPSDAVNVSVTVRYPGNWSTVTTPGNISVMGIFYGGGPGEFIFPPKFTTGTNVSFNINGTNSTLIPAPSVGWKSGFYMVRVSVNISGSLDSAEGFMMSKAYEGWAETINPTSLQSDFTTRSDENVSFRVSVFDIQQHRPAANLSVTKKKIMSFISFPPAELSYDENVTTGTTDSSGRVIMTLPVPVGGWSEGSYLSVFTVSNGTTSDTVEGFFMVKSFYAELQPTKWQYGTNETVIFDATISSDPSWMRMSMGGGGSGGCPPGDPMCGGGSSGGSGGGEMSGGSGGGSAPAEPTEISVNITTGNASFPTNLDNDTFLDVNMTVVGGGSGLNITSNGSAKIKFVGCIDWAIGSQCPAGSPTIAHPFDFPCDRQQLEAGGANTSLNASGAMYYCMNSSSGKYYKIETRGFAFNSSQIFKLAVLVDGGSGGTGGSSGLQASNTSGTQYYNATLKSLKLITFSWDKGEIVVPISAYNVTSADGTIIGVGNITIPGTGKIKLKPLQSWSSWGTEFFRVVAEFNVSTKRSKGDSGFGVQVFMATCNRFGNWGPVASGATVTVNCEVRSPQTQGNYSERVDISISRIRNTRTWQDASVSDWSAPPGLYTDGTIMNRTFQITATSLTTGQYEAVIRINSSSASKEQRVWFEVKDFEPVFFSDRWSVSANDNASFIAYGMSSGNMMGGASPKVRLNASNATVYRYDKATWAKSSVNVNTTYVVDTNLNMTYINLSRAAGWDEGSYEVVLNLSKYDTTGGRVEVKSWFEVKLFSVGIWSARWSNYPTDNVTFWGNVYEPSGWGQAYNGNVTMNITSVINTRTGIILTRGVDYNTTGVFGNLAILPERRVAINITPIDTTNGLPNGDYRATVSVLDNLTGKTVTADTYFNVVAYYFYSQTDRWEYGSGEMVRVNLFANRPDGSFVNLTNATITRMDTCGQSVCSQINVNNSYTTDITAQPRFILLNISNLSSGFYSFEIQVTDNRGIIARSFTGIKVGSFSLTGYIPKPQNRWDYYMNENMTLNVTGTIGATIENATFSYWECPMSHSGSGGNCVNRQFTINVSFNMTAANHIVNLTPPLNGSVRAWPMNDFAGYQITVYGTKSGEGKTFQTWSSARFPWIRWENISIVNWKYSPSDTIALNVSVYRDDERTTLLSNTNITIRSLVNNPYSDNRVYMNTSRYTASGNRTDASGTVNLTIQPVGSYAYPTGTLKILVEANYGGAIGHGDRDVMIEQSTVKVVAMTPPYGSTLNVTSNSIVEFNVTVENPTGTNAPTTNVRITSPMSGNITTSNLTALQFNVNVTPNYGRNMTTFRFNVTQSGNYSGTIYVTPSVAGMAASMTTYSFRVGGAFVGLRLAFLWNKTFVDIGGGYGEAYGVAVDLDNSILVAGVTNLNESQLVKYTPNGTILWNNTQFLSFVISNFDIAVDYNNSIVVSAISDNNIYDNEWQTIKYDTTGNKLWNKTYIGPRNDGGVGETASDKPFGIAVDSNNSIVTVGYLSQANRDWHVVKYTPKGEQSWNKTFVGIDGNDEARSVAIDKNGSIIVVGYFTNGANGQDWRVVKYNNDSGEVWNRTFGSVGAGNDTAYGVATDTNNSIYVTGSMSIDSGTAWQTIKYTSDGGQLWNRTFIIISGLTDTNKAQSILMDGNYSIFVTGYTGTSGYTRIQTVQYDSLGTQISNISYMGNTVDIGKDIAEDRNRTIVVAGYADFRLLKYGLA